MIFKDINDNILDNVMLNDGIAKTKVKISQAGQVIITAIYCSGDELLSDSRNSTMIHIKTRNPILTVNKIYIFLEKRMCLDWKWHILQIGMN